MKSNLRTIVIAAIAAVASVSPSLHAQAGWSAARVNVPFSFDYGKTHCGRGTYLLNVSSQNLLTIRGNGTVATVTMQAWYAPANSKPGVIQVMFRKYGDRYFLDEVQGQQGKVTLFESNEEKHAARELAARGAQPETVALALVPQPALGN